MSGLTIYVERLSHALVEQGHEVTVLTSQYDQSLPRYEESNGYQVRRVPVAFRVSKGVIMPTFGLWATRLVRQADVVHLHLPQFDAPGLALRGRLMGKPVVITYHCDLQLPSGPFNRVVDRVVSAMNRLAGTVADAVVTYTRDYGVNSPFLSRYVDRKLHIIPPPVTLDACSVDQRNAFFLRHALEGRRVIGVAGRLAAEKGIEVLLQALPRVLKAIPDALVLHAGPFHEVLGEEEYAARLAPLFNRFGDNYRLLGPLEGAEFTAFYQNLDCLVIPSLNRTESFGLVQIEAMMNGAPVAASDLPGVRQPVSMTGMGEIVPIGDPVALAEAIVKLLENRPAYRRDTRLITASFNPEQTAAAYVSLFGRLLKGNVDATTAEPGVYERLRRMRDDLSRRPGADE
jgi:glycosyltransferase involved in cell wall biosynthesis